MIIQDSITAVYSRTGKIHYMQFKLQTQPMERGKVQAVVTLMLSHIIKGNYIHFSGCNNGKWSFIFFFKKKQNVVKKKKTTKISA